MPVYEYYCADCHGVFELVRSVAAAAEAQPCPVCDAESQRLMPTSFHAFTLRDGVPRRIPDRGKYWHYGEEVDSPISQAVPMGEHPELLYERYGPPALPTVEEREAHEAQVLERMEYEAEQVGRGLAPTQDLRGASEARAFEQRVRETAPRAKLARRRAPNASMTPRTRSGKHEPSP